MRSSPSSPVRPLRQCLPPWPSQSCPLGRGPLPHCLCSSCEAIRGVIVPRGYPGSPSAAAGSTSWRWAPGHIKGLLHPMVLFGSCLEDRAVIAVLLWMLPGVSALLAAGPKSCLSVFPVTSDSLSPLSHLNRSSHVSIRVTGISLSDVSVVSLPSSHTTSLSGCARHSGCSLHVLSESSLATGEARDTSCRANCQEDLNKRRARRASCLLCWGMSWGPLPMQHMLLGLLLLPLPSIS